MAKYKTTRQIIAILMWVLIYGGLAFVSASVFGMDFDRALPPILVSLWLSSLFTHHVQLLEHGNLIVDGDFHERNIATRNIKHNAIVEKLFLFMAHQDPCEHVLHHTSASIYQRPFPGKVPIPEGTVFISTKDYARILSNMITKG